MGLIEEKFFLPDTWSITTGGNQFQAPLRTFMRIEIIQKMKEVGSSKR
jgi:hypothetical protein